MESTNETQKHISGHKHSREGSQLLEIQRTFKVPVQNLFDAFTDAETLKRWWWPKDLYADRIDWNFRQGGSYFINMKGDKGSGGMVGTIEHIVPNQLIVLTDHFADEHGNQISPQDAGMEGQWPETLYITFEFKSIDASTSELFLSQEGVPNELQADCIVGWSESFDKLKTYLEKT